jgi:hypothetical protein
MNVAQVQRRSHLAASMLLGRNGRHSLHFTTRKGGELNLWREQVDGLWDAMDVVTKTCPRPARVLHQLIGAGCPLLELEDVEALRRAIEEFNDEMAFEDRRPEPRTHPMTKIIRL